MREILYRGKRTDTGKWIEGSLLYSKVRNEALIWHEDEKDKYGYANTVIVPVDPSTVGQYIMLDKNGTRIFEGDIILYDGWSKRIIECGEAVWKEREVNGLHQFFTMINAPECYEVIGNVYDNSDLLNQTESNGF